MYLFIYLFVYLFIYLFKHQDSSHPNSGMVYTYITGNPTTQTLISQTGSLDTKGQKSMTEIPNLCHRQADSQFGHVSVELKGVKRKSALGHVSKHPLQPVLAYIPKIKNLIQMWRLLPRAPHTVGVWRVLAVTVQVTRSSNRLTRP